jgi:DNA repair protein RadD
MTEALVLRGYQTDCIAALRASFWGGRKAPLLVLPTAGGKTVAFAVVTLGARDKGNRVLVVVHRRELLKQASAKPIWAGVPHGIIAAGFKSDPDQQVQVGSIETIIRRLDKIGSFDLIVFDEAHHCQAETWRELIAAQPTAKLLGVTATPCRADGKGLGIQDGGCFDDLIVGPSIADLVKEGFLSPSRCFVPEHRLDMRGVRTQAGDYVASDVAAVVDTASITGDAIAQYTKHAAHLPAVAFCATVAHAEHVAEQFRSAGYRSVCVHDGTPAMERDAAIAGLGNGGVEVLTSCDLISEGLDVPAVGAVILLRPTKSFGLHMQQVGRGMRTAPGKDVLLVLDHVGNCIDHGLPTSPRQWTLRGVEKPPGAALQWRCPDCGCINDMADLFCAGCGEPRPAGFRKPPRQVAGELAELTAERFAAMRRMSFREMASKTRTEAELQEFASARGYHRGWVWHRLQEQDQPWMKP